MLNCQLCERISYILWKTRNHSFLSYQSRSFPSLLSLHIKPENLSPWGCNLLLSSDTRLRNKLICRKSERCIKAGNGEPVSTYIFLLITPQFYNIPVAHTFVFLCYNCFISCLRHLALDFPRSNNSPWHTTIKASGKNFLHLRGYQKWIFFVDFFVSTKKMVKDFLMVLWLYTCIFSYRWISLSLIFFVKFHDFFNMMFAFKLAYMRYPILLFGRKKNGSQN